ncbi:MAG: sulfite exporter TauE/SafE family protein [candidate division KSB1 bacterium]|jgi:uncharacterized membrane protein YfcA|nr:sulfite exporter TauE/SafE family protein [candidate division KSB1 bacterium]
MEEICKLIILFVVGAFASFINVNAGGGSSLTLPALIFIGLESAVANGTNRIGLILQNIFAVSSFHSQKFASFKLSLSLAMVTLPGAIIGAFASTRIPNEWFHRILAIVIIGIVISMFFKPRYEGNLLEGDKKSKWLFPALFGIGFYGGFIQVGVGFILMACLYHLLRVNLVKVNMHKVFIVLIYTLPALAVFIYTGNVNWKYGITLAAGMSVGGWWGARMAVKGGETAIRAILAIALIIMSIKLIT